MSGGFGDWDHYNGTAELDATTYVSSPSSLKRTATSTPQTLMTLTKAAAAQALINGRVVSQIRTSSTGHMPAFYFRYQDQNNYYVVALYYPGPQWYLYKVKAGVRSAIGLRLCVSWTPVINTFYKVRCTFWTSEGHLWARLEYWDGSSWIKQGDDISDVANEWPAGGRVGVGGLDGSAPTFTHHDDTEIWG